MSASFEVDEACGTIKMKIQLRIFQQVKNDDIVVSITQMLKTPGQFFWRHKQVGNDHDKCSLRSLFGNGMQRLVGLYRGARAHTE